jgi:hypothetical protein
MAFAGRSGVPALAVDPLKDPGTTALLPTAPRVRRPLRALPRTAYPPRLGVAGAWGLGVLIFRLASYRPLATANILGLGDRAPTIKL